MAMEISNYLLQRIQSLQEKRSLLVGICGRAGAGKTTLAEKIVNDLNDFDISSVNYSGDWRFIFDSKTRKKWLKEKWKVGIDAYVHAINQFNWWDFSKINDDLNSLSKGESIRLTHAYDRLTGKKDADITVSGSNNGIILYENCILGGVEVLENLDVILLLNSSDILCLERTIKKDIHRRTLPEIAARFLVTSYSENIFFNVILDKFSNKTVTCNSDGKLGEHPDLTRVSEIPIPLEEKEFVARKKGTIFCDLDGTLIKHVPIPSETGEEIEIIDGTIKKLKEFREKDYYLVLTTSRPYTKIFGIIEKLKDKGIVFDQIICDLPVGPRHLINDSKNDEIRAIAHVLKRDEGISSVKLE